MIDLERKLKATNLLPAVKRLMELEAISISENLSRGFKPKKETHVRLTDAYFSEEKLNALFDTLRRAPAQEALLLRYLDLAQAQTALNLNNSQLLAEVSRQALCDEQTSANSALSALRKKGVLATYDFVTSRLKLPTDKLSKGERQRFGGNVRSWPRNNSMPSTKLTARSRKRMCVCCTGLLRAVKPRCIWR